MDVNETTKELNHSILWLQRSAFRLGYRTALIEASRNVRDLQQQQLNLTRSQILELSENGSVERAAEKEFPTPPGAESPE